MKKFQDISNAYENLCNKDKNFKNHPGYTGQEWAQEYKYYPKSQHKYTSSTHEFYKSASRKTGANQEEFSHRNENIHKRYVRQRFLFLLLCSIFYLSLDYLMF